MRFVRYCIVATAVLCCVAPDRSEAQSRADDSVPALEVRTLASGRPLAINRLGAVKDKRGRALAVTRFDLLLSGLSLQRPDGTWTDGSAWYGFFRGEQPSRRQLLPSVPPGRYIAARFSVGVDAQANHGDPNRLAPDDPLHPVVNGMHWGWTGGYVFLAVEGHWQFDKAPAGSTGGFAYHLGGDKNVVRVELPTRIVVQPGSILRLEFDAGRMLSKIDVAADGESTHSRHEDAIVRALRRALPTAFALYAGPDLVLSTPATESKARRSTSDAYPFAPEASLPSVALPVDNPLTVGGVELGRRLFHDPRLSRDGRLSCASCHRTPSALADGGKTTSTGVGGALGARNTMPIFNLAWVSEFFWDGRAKGLRHAALDPIQHPAEMGESLSNVVSKLTADRQMAQEFLRVFGGPVSAERIGLALEQFLLTIVSQDSKFDRVTKGVDRFTLSEKRGFELFLTEHDPRQGLLGADCFHCHGGSLFTNNRFANTGLAPRGPDDLGRERVTGDVGDRGKFRTPSLRNVAVTAPYMHDGRFKTLEDVIDHYDHGVVRGPTLDPNLAKHPSGGMKLSREDKAALVDFLRTLTDSRLVSTDRKPADARASR